MAETSNHPYYPQSLQIPGFVAQQWTDTQILSVFFGAIAVISPLALAQFAKLNPEAPTATRLVFLWFLLCGFIHTVLESYFVAFSQSIASRSGFLADLWKEYANSDSRYMTQDPTVVVVEGITGFVWGPLCFLTASMILNNNPGRHVLQFAISFGQLYGDVLYYLSMLLERTAHYNPNPYYFWFYFVVMNFPWIVIPTAIMWGSGSQMYAALTEASNKRRVNQSKEE